jgi:uncharacterized protein (DUF58 family)
MLRLFQASRQPVPDELSITKKLKHLPFATRQADSARSGLPTRIAQKHQKNRHVGRDFRDTRRFQSGDALKSSAQYRKRRPQS